MNEQRLIEKLSKKFNIEESLLDEYLKLFKKYKIPVNIKNSMKSKRANNVLVVSTHGYWGDPPPAGVPDTGGQTYYVLETSKAWGNQNRRVIIIARWFKPYPRIEKFGKNVWLIRVRAGGDDFIRKEDIYPLVPQMAEASTAIAALFGANAAMGHYADGMVSAVEVGERLSMPVVTILHSLGLNKLIKMGEDPYNAEAWFNDQYNFWVRESYEVAALKGTNFEIANTPHEPEALKDYYHFKPPYSIMPAGAGTPYFEAVKKSKLKVLKKFKLESKKYFLYFGRFSEAKNINGVVATFGTARKINPKYFKDKKLVLVGGSSTNPQDEELLVEDSIKKAMAAFNFTEKNVIRISSQGWDILATLAHHSIAYIGMQVMEPFGMAAAEAMAAKTPVLISRRAGISRWLEDGKNALFVRPKDVKYSAKILIKLIENKVLCKKIAIEGNRLAHNKFSWSGIAKDQGKILDQLCSNKCPRSINSKKEVYLRRTGRAHHRIVFAWRGDPPIIREKHKRAADGLLSYISGKTNKAKMGGKRILVAIGGESGAGKTEIAEYLRFLLRKSKLKAVTISGDAFFKLTPAANHKARMTAYRLGQLESYLGPQEVDMKRLEDVAKHALNRKTKKIFVPSDCRSLKSRRYKNVPIDLANIDVILIDLTYSLLLKNASLKVFLESDFKSRLEEIKERNLKRDPDQDFTFIQRVLEIEHEVIQKLKKKADIIVDKNYKPIASSKRLPRRPEVPNVLRALCSQRRP